MFNIPFIPIEITVLIIALIVLTLLTIFNSKLQLSTVTKTEYIIEIITAIGLLLRSVVMGLA